ncbi:nitrous oxide reductase family maturation protein NosD [Pseudomonadota bacterium]
MISKTKNISMCLILILPILSISTALSTDKIIYVDDDGEADYNNIQDAIDAASENDTIFVYSGWYNETLLIEKQVTLIGENRETTLIDGGGRDDVITLGSERIKISNFTIQNSCNDVRVGWWKAGIRILSSHVIIEENIIQNNLLGIFIKQVEHLTIRNNWFYNDSITIFPYDTNYSTRPNLEKKHFIHQIQDNYVNDKPLLYYVDESDMILSSDIGQLILVNCTNISLIDTEISSADFPVLFVLCHACRIENMTFLDNDGMCAFLESDNNTICYNYFQNNLHGLLLDYGSESNQIYYNTFTANRFCGVVCEYFSNENSIYQNDFIENPRSNAFVIRAFKNEWNENYWSDWIGLQSPMYQNFPKMIVGTLFDLYQYIPSLINFDFNPRLAPHGF